MGYKFNLDNPTFRKNIESKITISGRSIKKINKYVDKFYTSTQELSFEVNMNKLSEAKKEYNDCICLLEESGDWKAFILRKNHTGKIVIHLRLFSNYFRNLENFVDSFLFQKLKIRRSSVVIHINELLPDRDFAPVFIQKTIWKQLIFSVIINGTAICLSYFKFIEVDKKTGTDLIWLVAAANSYAIFDVLKSIIQNRNNVWIKA